MTVKPVKFVFTNKKKLLTVDELLLIGAGDRRQVDRRAVSRLVLDAASSRLVPRDLHAGAEGEAALRVGVERPVRSALGRPRRCVEARPNVSAAIKALRTISYMARSTCRHIISMQDHIVLLITHPKILTELLPLV